VEPHGQARQNNGGQARGTTLFRRFASRTAGLSGTTSRSSAHSSTAKAVAFCERGKWIERSIEIVRDLNLPNPMLIISHAVDDEGAVSLL